MSETKTTSLVTLSPSNGAILAIPSQSPTLEVRALHIRRAHDDVAAAILTAVERALDAGLQLTAAKAEIGHGRFEAYVARCGISMRTAQNYMRLARYEPKVRELVSEKAQGNAYLTMPDALKEIARLEAKKKPKRRAVANGSKMLKLFGVKR